MRQDIETRHSHKVEAAIREGIHLILVEERFSRWVVSSWGRWSKLILFHQGDFVFRISKQLMICAELDLC